MTDGAIFHALGVCVVGMPALLLSVLGLAPLFFRPLGEATKARLTAACVGCGLSAALLVLVLMLASGARSLSLELGNWVALPEEHFHFHLKLVFDRLSVPFVILTFVLVGTIGVFANRYLHREAGYARFFLLYALFLLGMVVAALAGTIEALFLGWELVGLSSALLVAFFHDRTGPVWNGQWIWSIYRISDAAFLIAAVVLHRVLMSGDFAALMGTGAWPEGEVAMTSSQATAVGLLLLLAAAGKSALVPFSGWLPRAMEGPTPSSAIFYGALSVHLGAYLLLRVSPVLERSFWLGAAVTAVGLASALFGAVAGRVQTDIKSGLAYASLTQVGTIVAEIGLGLRYVPLVHIIGHAVLRTLQLLRAPSLLHDYGLLENAVGGHLHHEDGPSARWGPARLRRGLYRLGFHRGQFDAAIERFLVRPFVQAFRWCDAMERRWTDMLDGTGPREPNRAGAPGRAGEEA